jgi:hypothetical protein
LARLDVLKKRFRIMGDSKPKVQVQTTSRLETMTVTQEWRFKQLQRIRVEEHRRKVPANRAWYTLTEACIRLVTTPDSLLRAAAEGKVTCYVASEGLRGRWGPQDNAAGARASRADISHFRLTRAACREAAAHGGVNVTVLRHPTVNGQSAQFLLEEPLRVAPERILLKHPLPSPGTY